MDAANKIKAWLNRAQYMFPMTKIYYASEVESTARNIISVGEPCTNAVTQQIVDSTECGFGLEKGEFTIRLYENDGFFNIIAGGSSPDLTGKAADKLVDHDYDEFNLSGRNMVFGQCNGCVTDDYECVVIGTRTDTKFCGADERFSFFKQIDKICKENYECESGNCYKEQCKPSCDGCFGDNFECYPLGARTSSTFCDGSKEFVIQKNVSASCKFGYECKTSVCKESSCFEPNIFKRFFNWIISIF